MLFSVISLWWTMKLLLKERHAINQQAAIAFNFIVSSLVTVLMNEIFWWHWVQSCPPSAKSVMLLLLCALQVRSQSFATIISFSLQPKTLLSEKKEDRLCTRLKWTTSFMRSLIPSAAIIRFTIFWVYQSLLTSLPCMMLAKSVACKSDARGCVHVFHSLVQIKHVVRILVCTGNMASFGFSSKKYDRADGGLVMIHSWKKSQLIFAKER